jgi:Zn-dependent protease with chaperone function
MAVEHLYPAGPGAVPADLTRPTKAYRTHAWLAMAGLTVFIVLYLALASWFSWTAYRLLAGVVHGGDAFWGLIAGIGSAFLAVFMLKALFFVQHRYAIDDIEVTAQEQPRLFAFINRLADEAGAPRAHRVFLSPRVNAAVFYDLSVLNLFFPSRKNLEIGLGLVNAISLGELKAVLAHEFGHFGQRSMAVGRWVYIAQQIAGHIVAKRDALDSLLRTLSRLDLRIAWVGWLLSLIVWSIRSLMETMFRLVVLAQRALSREMELQADLVAVSLTGSDALIHALHKLHAADEAWERALGFANAEVREKRAVSDLFAVQKHITAKLREVLDDPNYGEAAPLPQERPDEHRVFKTALAQPPRMWSTHPANSEREQNAKRRYIPAAIDARSAWELFDDVVELKRQMTAHVYRSIDDAAETPIEQSLGRLEEQYKRSYYDRAYRGAYLGRALTLHARDAAELYRSSASAGTLVADLDALYPQQLAHDLEKLRALEDEKQSLQGLKEGFLTAHGGVIRHRGRDLKRADLQAAIDEVEVELGRAREAVLSHDRRVRAVHLAAAAQLGGGWDAYLKGLLSILHYAEHGDANVQDAHGALRNVLSIVTADGRVSAGERKRLLDACAELHNALRGVYEDEGNAIVLDRTLLRRLKVESWRQALGEFGLPPASDQNIGDWLNAIDGWVSAASAALSALRQSALEQLLLVEAQVARFTRGGMKPGAAPEATRTPSQYPVLPAGSERPRQKKLDLWDRFHVADGAAPTIARLAVACGIIAAVVSVGATVGATRVNVYNGLARPVTVSIGDASANLAPYSRATLDPSGQKKYMVKAATTEGRVIEQFEMDIPIGSDDNLYNVAGASALVEWTATYGSARERPERMLGAVRWARSDASHIFEDPPESISTSTRDEGGTRDVVSAYGHDSPQQLFAIVQDEAQRWQIINAHARWDASDAPNTVIWLGIAAGNEAFDEIIRDRLALQPHDVLTLRAEQDHAKPGMHAVVCQRHQALARAAPTNPDLAYVAARCIEDEVQRAQAFTELHAKSPRHGWLSLAVGYTHAEHGRWAEAAPLLDTARELLPAMRERLALDVVRVKRMTGEEAAPSRKVAAQSTALNYYLAVQSGKGLQPGLDRAYHHLGRGDLAAVRKELEQHGDADRRALRLAAASDGAARELVEASLALPLEQGVDAESVWTALALALRERRDPAPYLAAIREYEFADAQVMLDFITAIRSSPDFAQAETLLDGLDLALRGHAYSAAVVLLGERAPPAWREAARRLLFIPERPYFRMINTADGTLASAR